MKKEHKIGIAVLAFIVVLIIGIINGGGKTTPAVSTSPTVTAR